MTAILTHKNPVKTSEASVTERTFPARSRVDVPGGRLAQEILAQAGPGVRAISFDVFETVVTRNVGEPEGMFYQIGRDLVELGVIEVSPSVFASARKVAERRARQNKTSQEVSLRKIYEELTHHLGLESKLEELCEVELEAERKAIRAIPAMREVIDRIREKTGKIVFISDMYLSHDFLEEVLKREGLLEPGDSLYVSSTYGLQKYRTGDLFLKAMAEEGLDSQTLFHVGNSPISDIEPAAKHGIRTYLFQWGNSNTSENVLNEHGDCYEGFSCGLAGASRRARLKGVELEGGQRAMWECGASVTGPIAFLYAHWILAEAEKLGVERLLFLARDAYLPYLAVENLLQQRKSNGIEISYIYGSRPTYHALGLQKLEIEEWQKLTEFAGGSFLTLKSLAKCFLLEEGTLRSILPKVGLEGIPEERFLTEAELNRLRNLVLDDPEVNALFLDDIKKYQDRMRRYLQKEGVEEGAKVAMVDSGWTTKSHAPFFQFLRGMGCQEIKVFYIGLTIKEPAIPVESVRTFLFNRATNHGEKRKDMAYARPLESLFISPHGRTEAINEDGGQLKPGFAAIENKEFLERYYGYYQAGFESFLDEAEDVFFEYEELADCRGLCEKLLRRFWMAPSREEARTWSTLTWEWDPLGNRQYTLAKPYEFKDCLVAFKNGAWPELYPQFWIGGARKLTNRRVIEGMNRAVAGGKTMRGFLKGLRNLIKGR